MFNLFSSLFSNQSQNLSTAIQSEEEDFEDLEITQEEESFIDFVVFDENKESDSQQQIIALSNKEWVQVLQNNSIHNVNQEVIYKSLQRGLPYSLRRDIWLELSNVNQLKNKYKNKFTYNQLAEKESKDDFQIKKDLNRTYNDFSYFIEYNKQEDRIEGQYKLFRILRAYTNFDEEVGYTGGMNFIVASLLLNLNPEKDKDIEIIDNSFEENVFWIFVHIMVEKNWRNLFLEGTPGIFQVLNRFEAKLQQELPQIRNKIIDIGLSISACFPQYFITILLYNSPKTLQKRIIDLFLFKGEEALIQIIINMLKICEEIILKVDDAEVLMQFLRKGIMNKCQNIFKNQQEEEQYLIY